MPRVHHPNPKIPSFYDVPDADLQSWTEAGWQIKPNKQTQPPASTKKND